MTLSELCGTGWTIVDPPFEGDKQSVIARYNGEAIKAGFTLESEEENGEIYTKFRSGVYDLELKFDLEIGRARVRVNEASEYS